MATRRPRESTALQFRTIHGHRRAFRMMGSGPAILLLHGIGDSSESWVPLIEPLARHFTVIAPDLLGHGASDKPRADYSVAAYANGMRDLMEVLGVERATIVGHSLGGGVAAQIAYQYPERCERLVLVATGGVSSEVASVLRVAAAPLAELALLPLRLPGARWVARVASQVLRLSGHDLGRDADEMVRVFDGLPDGSAQVAFTRTLRSVVDWRGQVVTMLDRTYLTDAIPILLIWGAHDGIIPARHAQLAHDAIPGSRLSIYPDAGHFPHRSDPERFVAELEAFIAETAPGRHQPERFRRLLRDGRAQRSTGRLRVV